MKIRVQNNHGHAVPLFTPTSWRHYSYLFISIFLAKVRRYTTLTQHLPLEIQHPKQFPKSYDKGYRLIKFGEFLSRLFKVNLCWENAPLLNYGTWDLKYGQIDWDKIPGNINLCIDTGHLMLGSKDKQEARRRVTNIVLKRFPERVKHLHIHENDLKVDRHWQPNKRKLHERILNKSLIEKIIKGRTYIYERS
ncbi:hypothetical protein GYA28_03635 [Candidatus Roizmanbacteria bacterium]|jgi:hypothetical protein|nr:hypothetical protein [Candidatus Roizmanbacteria bacterium]